jgi:hypothetical protein
VALPASRRRSDVKITKPAARHRTGMTMTRMSMSSSYSSKKRPSAHGKMKSCPGPRKNEPMMVRVAQAIMKMVKSEIANLRSSGLLDGFLSM